MSRWVAGWTLAVLLAACGGLTDEEYAEVVSEARVCQAGDSCVLAGAGDCTCPTPVNGQQQQTVEEAAADVDCNGARVKCASLVNLRCENEICVADRE